MDGARAAMTIADPTLAPYLNRLQTRPPGSAEREAEAALALRNLKLQYWRRLLAIRQLLPAMLTVLRDALGDKLPAELRRRGRTWWNDADLDDETLSRLADALLDVDPSCELADRIAADVHALAAGHDCEALTLERRPRPELLRHESARLSSCRAAWSAARKEFVATNLRLVVKMARRYEGSGRLPLADLVQEGNVGLLTAADRFDPRRGFRFSTYAAWWIRHAISRALSDTGRTVRLPVHVIALQLRLARVRAEFERTHSRAPDPEELAALAEVPVEKIIGLERTLLEPVGALSSREEDDVGMGGVEDSATALHDDHMHRALLDALDQLDPNQLRLLRMRYGLDGEEAMTLREVGESYQLSRERIRQLQEVALKVLRGALERRGFARYDVAEESF
jgi:RNA polymerase primary sigma factor